MSANFSIVTKSERDLRINSFRSSNENEEDLKGVEHDSKAHQLKIINKMY